MRYVSSERLLDVMGWVLVGAAAASALSAAVKPSEFRAKSERTARLHQLEALTAQAEARTLTMATAGGLVRVSVTPMATMATASALNPVARTARPDVGPNAGFVEHASYRAPSEVVLADAR